jgi:hypothetical protein
MLKLEKRTDNFAEQYIFFLHAGIWIWASI